MLETIDKGVVALVKILDCLMVVTDVIRNKSSEPR